MSKYIIDTGDYLFTTDGVLVVGFDCDNKPATFYNSLDNLEELNSDYINEHFGELQDEAYKKGYEDGKKSTERGCEGCKYHEDTSLTNPCSECTRAWKDHYTPTPHSDRIEVGDEVIYNGTTRCVVIVPETDKRYASILDCNGIHYSADHRELKKTGKHYDIASILEAMRT